MRVHVYRFPLFCLLLFGFPLALLSGPGSVAGNSVDFDPPPKGGLNPDSPAAGSITATGFTTSAQGWTCTKIEITVKELPSLKQVDYKMVAGAATWKYAKAGLNKGTHSVAVQALWQDNMAKLDVATAAQTVTVK